ASGLVGQWASTKTDGRDGRGAKGRTGAKPDVSSKKPALVPTGNGERGTRNAVDELSARLARLGLPTFETVQVHRNEQVMLSWVPGKILRIHEGYAAAPDEVLQAIVRYVTPRVRRPARLAAKRIFLAFPVEEYAPR